MPSILSPLQRQVLDILFQSPEFTKDFFLTGGCALSWGYLEHRMSEDLDFFSRGEPDLDSVGELLTRLLSLSGIRLEQLRSGPHFRRYQVTNFSETTLLDLVTQDQPEVGHLVLKEAVQLDSLVDIAVNKLIALEREEIKDSVDLYILLRDHEFDIFDLLEKAKKKTMDAEDPKYALRVARLLTSAGNLPNFDRLQLVKPVDRPSMIAFLKEQAGRIYEQYR